MVLAVGWSKGEGSQSFMFGLGGIVCNAKHFAGRGAVRGVIEMADWFYCVDLSRDEDSARERRYVEKFLVELVCDDHSNDRHNESYRETSASDIAMNAFENRYGSQAAEDIGYKRANRYRGAVPTNLGEASFTASCGCLAWHF